jgi:hypothetical protein
MVLVKRTEQYRVETEEEAINLIQKFKDKQNTDGYEITKSSYTMKTKKAKGEVIDMFFLCDITMKFSME